MRRNIAKAMAYSFAGICAYSWALFAFVWWDWAWPMQMADWHPDLRFMWAMIFLVWWAIQAFAIWRALRSTPTSTPAPARTPDG